MGKILPIIFNTDMVRAILREVSPKTATRRTIKGYIPSDAIWGYTEFTPKGYISCRGTFDDGYGEKFFKLPYQKGDILYIRETWAFQCCIECMNLLEDESCMIEKVSTIHEDKDADSEGCYIYRADHPHPERIIWCPSIHMPKLAARIWLNVMDVRVERLQDIDGLGAYNEGAKAEVPTILNGLKFPDGFENWSEDKKDKWFENAGRHTYMAKLELANRLITDFKKIWNATISTKDLNKYSWEANPWVWVIEFERCENPESEG